MTPDLSTPEGRAELRALLASGIPLPWATRANLGFGDIYVVTKHPDAAPTKEEPCRDFVADLSLRNESTAHLIAAAVNALGPLLDILDAAYVQEGPNSRPKTIDEMREMMANDPEYRAGFWRRVAKSDRARHERWLDDLQAKLDAAHATIERLTAPATEGEGFDAAYHGDSLTGFDDASDMREVLDAFIARRKEATP